MKALEKTRAKDSLPSWNKYFQGKVYTLRSGVAHKPIMTGIDSKRITVSELVKPGMEAKYRVKHIYKDDKGNPTRIELTVLP